MKYNKYGKNQRISAFISALKVSIQAKDLKSLVFCCVGFPAALLPILIGNSVETFSDQVLLLQSGKMKLSTVISLCAVLSILYALQAAMSAGKSYFSQRDTISVQKYLKRKVIQTACSVKYEYIQNKDKFLEKIGFAESNAGKQVANAIQSMVTWIQNIISLVAILVLISKVDVRIVIFLIVSCIPTVIFSRFQSDEAFYSNNRRTLEFQLVMNDYTELVGPTEMQEVHFWKIKEILKKHWRKDAQEYSKEAKVLVARHLRQNILCDLVRNSVFIIVLLFTIYDIYNSPEKGVGTFMVVMTLAGQMQTLTIDVLTWIATFSTQMHYIQAFFSLDSFEKDIKSLDPPIKNGTIELDNVSFSYPGSNVDTINNISLKIEQGEHIAIVGKNGSGKTTLVNLICGLYSPSKGTIKVNGDKAINRQYISAIFQDFCKYHASIKDNIMVSDLNQQFDNAKFLECCRATGVDQIVDKYSDKYDTMVGGFSESGTNLSGGQWQKIAIARALYRNQANIMLLDEPAAALDAEAEENLYNHFDEITKDKTTILISHRLAATKVVDRILVMEDGKIVEDGTHTDLMNKNGVYANMFRLQAGLYR